MNRADDLNSLYQIIETLKNKLGGFRRLSECSGATGWPDRGIYLFFEDREFREDCETLRVVRVGTHAITSTSRTTLWNRLRTHRGNLGGAGAEGGNPRGSIFRKRVGEAMLRSGTHPNGIVKTWGVGNTAPKDVRLNEFPLEKDVSRYIGQMPFLWIGVPDAPSPSSDRAYLERNCIAILSNSGKPVIDAASTNWLGLKSDERTIRESGLWNTNHVDEAYSDDFLDRLRGYVPAKR